MKLYLKNLKNKLKIKRNLFIKRNKSENFLIKKTYFRSKRLIFPIV